MARTRFYYEGNFHQDGSEHHETGPKTERQKMLDKISKLLALAEGTNHSGEAENAKRLAIELLTKYNLSVIDLNIRKENDTCFEVHEDSTDRKKRVAGDESLSNILAKFNGVLMLRCRQDDGIIRYKYIGTRANIEAFRYRLEGSEDGYRAGKVVHLNRGVGTKNQNGKLMIGG